MKNTLSVAIVFTLSLHLAKAQLVVDTSYTVGQMVDSLMASSGAEISNITFTGAKEATGMFHAANTNLGLNSGMLLTTGFAMNAIGPNNWPSTTWDNLQTGDSDLSTIAGVVTYDAAVIQFDMVPGSDTLLISYVFGSDEYPEFANDNYSDLFGFFITGPGYANQNIALLPDTSLPVEVNTINCQDSSPYYVCNDPFNIECSAAYNCPSEVDSTTIQYDGFTTVLSIITSLIPGETYHIKIAIADVLDGEYDSGVFLKNLTTGYPLSTVQIPDEALSVQPNPVSSTLNIHLKKASAGELNLFDVEGKLLLSKQINSDVQLDLSSFISGTYFLEFTTRNQVHHQKILKQ